VQAALGTLIQVHDKSCQRKRNDIRSIISSWLTVTPFSCFASYIKRMRCTDNSRLAKVDYSFFPHAHGLMTLFSSLASSRELRPLVSQFPRTSSPRLSLLTTAGNRGHAVFRCVMRLCLARFTMNRYTRDPALTLVI
jgi:hypothetical protein